MVRTHVLKLIGACIILIPTLIYIWRREDISFAMDRSPKPAYTNPQLRNNPAYTNPQLRNNPSQCGLTWNSEKLNVDVYEANGKVFEQSSKNLEENYIPPLVYSNPQIMLDRLAYLLPELKWGPNNQLLGFFESVFLAIRLNRTLVLPSFRKHDTDSQLKKGSRNLISPLHRVDIGTLCRYISCVFIDHFNRYCNHEIDGIIYVSSLNENELRTIEKDTNMKVRRLGEQSKGRTPLIPSNAKKPISEFLDGDIRSFFSSKARCVVHALPFRNLIGTDKKGVRLPLVKLMIDNTTLRDPQVSPDLQLMLDIVKHTQRPSYIQGIAREFIHLMTNDEPFISIHWRYDRKDYLSRGPCPLNEISKQICDKARHFNGTNMARRVLEKVNMLSNRNIKVSTAYIATPLSEQNFLQLTAKSLKDFKVNMQIFDANDLEKFMKGRYFGCDFLSIHFEDILSSVEMEVCSRSVSFLGSLGSTWSWNVIRNRLTGLDKSQYETFPEYVFNL